MSNSVPGLAPHSGNPILPGYFADPSLVQHDGKYYLYATIDPWGGDALGCWECGRQSGAERLTESEPTTAPSRPGRGKDQVITSEPDEPDSQLRAPRSSGSPLLGRGSDSLDFRNWTYRRLNWPTTEACRSATSGGAKVWAPSVVQGRDGRFFMYVSVGSEVWAGAADHPLGPWTNVLGDRPLIPGDFRPGYHMIDAEAFVDDDGVAWLYWGSGWGWVNGRCWAARLGPDMASFDGEVYDVTPDNYFEAPFMFKRDGRYYLMYSNGRTDQDTYHVRYAVGSHPLGPFIEGPNSPILVSDAAANVLSPGHHAVFALDGKTYILYHRHSIPFDPDFIGRQVCVDELRFTADCLMETVVPTHTGPDLIRRGSERRANIVANATLTASSQAGPHFGAERVIDDNYASRWAADGAANGAWLQLDLGEVRQFALQSLRFEYAWKPYRFTARASRDGQNWETLADFRDSPAQGSPVLIDRPGSARYLRLEFPQDVPGADISLFEWVVHTAEPDPA